MGKSMRLVALCLALSTFAPQPTSHADHHDDHGVVASQCHCPKDCPCKRPGGTCPVDGPCVKDCKCDKRTNSVWIHPQMQAAIENTEKLEVDDLLFQAGEEEIVDGEARHTGFRPLRSMYEGAQFKEFPIWQGKLAGQEIPVELDYTKIAPPKVVAQKCGDCWAQGAAMAFEGVIGWLDKANRDISRQAIIDCSGYGSCNGGQISVGFFKDPKGAVYTSDYGYVGRNQQCRQASLIRKEKARNVGFIRGSSGGKPTVQDYQRAMMEMGPIEVCGAASALSGADRDGFILTNKSGATNHCWAAYGWLEGSLHGKPKGIYFIFVNSWGDGSNGNNWAKNGIGYLRMATDDVNIRGSAVTEGAYIDYKDPVPPGPVDFSLVSSDIEIHAHVDVAGVAGVDKLKLRLQEVIDLVGRLK